MKLICPACFEEYEMPDSTIGQRVECPCGKKWNVLPNNKNQRLKELFGYKLGEKDTGIVSRRNVIAGDSFYGISSCEVQKDKKGNIQQIAGTISEKNINKAVLLTKQILICICRKFNLSPHDFTESEKTEDLSSVKYTYATQYKGHYITLVVQRFPSGADFSFIQVILFDIGPDFQQDLSYLTDEESESDDEDYEDLYSEPATLENVIEKYPQFAGVCFGKDCPTEAQFSYALHLGINVDKKTFSSISTAIDNAKSSSKKKKSIDVNVEDEDVLYEYLVAKSPASSEYIEEIKEFHADLSRPITNAEAEEVIEFLEKHHINCPYCKKQLDSVMFSMDSCPFCDGSFRKLKIPIFL